MTNSSDELLSKKMTGKVKHVRSNDKGIPIYGFINPDDPTVDDVFVHYKEIEPWRVGFKEFEVGQVVQFELWKTVKGLSARNVEIKRDRPNKGAFKTTQQDREAR